MPKAHRRKLVLRAPRIQKKFPAIGQKIIRKISDLDLVLRPLGVQLNLEPSEYARDLFCRLSLATQRKVLSGLQLYIDTLQDLQKRNQDPWDSLKFSWAFLKNAGLHPHSRMFEKIGRDDVVEVYNRDLTQVFRNLQFLEIFNLSFFDLLILDRMTILRADPKLEERIFLKMDSALRQNKGVEPCDFAELIWIERFGLEKASYQISYKNLGSLMSRGKKPSRVEGVLITSQAEALISASTSMTEIKISA